MVIVACDALFFAFWGCFRCCVSSRFLCFLSAREKGRRAKFDIPSTRKPVFSHGARPRRRSPKDDNRRPKKALNKGSTKCEKHQNIIDFSASRGRPPKIPPKRASRRSNGVSRGPPDGPKRRQERPKSAPRRLQEPPRALQEPSRGGSGAALAATWGRPRAQEAPEASRRPFGPPRGSIFYPPGGGF